MRRREFIAGLGSAAAWPVVARAQQPALPLVGWLGTGSPDGAREGLAGLKQGLAASTDTLLEYCDFACEAAKPGIAHIGYNVTQQILHFCGARSQPRRLP